MTRFLLAGLSCAPMLTLLLMCASPVEAKRVAPVIRNTQHKNVPKLQKDVKTVRPGGAILPVAETAQKPTFRVAKTLKYERPKTTQRAPTRYKVQVKAPRAPEAAPTIQKAPSIQKSPSIRKRSSTSRKPSRRAPKRTRSRRASMGSCGGCRNSCYVSYRVRSHSRQFVPCMRQCWYQACRLHWAGLQRALVVDHDLNTEI